MIKKLEIYLLYSVVYILFYVMEILDNMDVVGVVKDMYLLINEVKGSIGNKLVILYRDI